MTWWKSKAKKEIPPKPDGLVSYRLGFACPQEHVSTEDRTVCPACGEKQRPAVLREIREYTWDGEQWSTSLYSRLLGFYCPNTCYEFVRFMDEKGSCMNLWESKAKQDELKTEEIFRSGYVCSTNHHPFLAVGWVVSPKPPIVCRNCGDYMRPAVLRETLSLTKRGWESCTPQKVEFVRFLDEPKPRKKHTSEAEYEAWMFDLEKILRRPLYRTEMCLAAGLYTQPSEAKDAAQTIRDMRQQNLQTWKRELGRKK